MPYSPKSKTSLTDMGNETLKLANQVHGSLVRRWRRATSAALGLDVSTRACLDVVVRDIAAIRDFIPDGIPADVGALGLAGDFDVGALLQYLLDRIAGAWARAALNVVAGDGVCGCKGGREGRKGKESELHGEQCSVEGKLKRVEGG